MSLSSVLFLFMQVLNAQIITGEQPIGLILSRNFVSYSDTTVQILPVPDRTIINREDSITDSQPGPLRFAYPVQVNYTLYNSGAWQVLANGDKLWRLKVKLPGALSTNAVYDKFWLPEGAKFFVYSEETEQFIGAITPEFIGGSYEEPVSFATALIYGENVIFEYYQPALVKDSAVISIPNIYYGYRYVNNPYTAKTQDLGDAGSCNVNINCSEGNNWQMEKHAVARISIPISTGMGWCSCALINNTNNDNTPYALTSAHCLIGNVSQWMFYWDYEYPECSNSGTPLIKSTTGATVKANYSVSDFALLQLSQNPGNLNNFVPYYLGWDRSSSSTDAVGIHHPVGDVKKISVSNNIQIQASQVIWPDGTILQANTHWKVVWNTGTTEGGSSGSPLMNNNHRIIGQLHGGFANCSALTQPDWYGKFSISWTGGGTNATRLSNWIDPLGTNPVSLNGKSYIEIIGPTSICNSVNVTFTASGAPSGYTWTYSSGLSLVSISGNSATFSTNSIIPSSGSGWIGISVNGVEIARKGVGLGIGTYFDGSKTTASTYVYYGKVIPRSSYFDVFDKYEWWTEPGTGWTITDRNLGAPMQYVQISGSSSSSESILRVRAHNTCGWSNYQIVNTIGISFDVTPNLNQETGTLNIEIAIDKELYAAKKAQLQSANTTKEFNAEPVFNIKLYNDKEIVQRSKDSVKEVTSLDVSALPEGLYYLHVYSEVDKNPDIREIYIKKE
jgi:hypothetical protein